MPTLVLARRCAVSSLDLVSELRNHGFEVVTMDDPAALAGLDGEEADAILLCTDDPGAAAVSSLTRRLCRRQGWTLLLAGGRLTGRALLELFADGVADYVPAPFTTEEVAVRLLAAIERDRTRRELRRGDTAFRHLFDRAVSPMAISDLKGRLIEANDAFAELLGYPLDKLRQFDVPTLLTDDAENLAVFERMASGEMESCQVRARLRAEDGSTVWADLHASRLVDPTSGAVHLISDFNDLTPEVTTRRALDRVRDRFEALFEQVPSGILVLDLTTMRFSEVNRAAEQLFGYSRDELKRRGIADLWSGVNSSPAEIEQLLRRERRVGPMRQLLRRKDGVAIETEVSLTPCGDGDGLSRMLLVRDVNTQRQLEISLERSRARQAADRQPTALLHDLANLLTIHLERHRSLAELLPRDGETRRRVDEASRLGSRVIELIHRFLASTRPAAPSRRPLELSTTVERTRELVEAIVGDGVEVTVEGGDEPLPVWFDANELDQVLLNLTTNARDAMQGRGRLTLSTRRSPAGNPHGGGWARLSVKDTGSGIRPELNGKIFEPYFTTKPEGTGTGIGLATVDRLVRRGGGRIEVESEVGGGTTFHVDLPLDAGRSLEPVTEDHAWRGDGKPSLLLVDDDEAVCGLVCEMLEAAGYRVLSSTRGQDALHAAEHYPGTLDLLIADASLTDVPMHELIARVRHRRPELGVLVVSGYLDGVLAANGILGEDTPFLPKPFTAPELLAKVEETIGLAATDDA